MKILIVEDNFEIAASYRSEFKKHNIVSDIATGYVQGLNLVKNGDYDIALLDINLPDGSGAQLLKEIRNLGLDIGIIMITARPEEQLISDSLDSGADDYLQKPVRYTELVARVNAVHRRVSSRQTTNLHVENIEIDYGKSLVYINGQIKPLTNKEFLIVAKLSEIYPGYCSTEALNSAVCDQYEASSASIRVHIYNLKKKLADSQIVIDNSKNLGYRLCFQQ